LFTYDGLGRRVQIIEKQNGVAISTNKFLWDGQTLCEQRDLTGGTVVKRFFGQGEQISGTNYFFTRDHLGSVREMTDSSGAIQARYDYDPYGRKTKISGSLDADFGYAGMYCHAVSGLNLTLFRAYDADLGRWLSRDPIQEFGGLNLYAYVDNNPMNWIDPLGFYGAAAEGNAGGVNRPPVLTMTLTYTYDQCGNITGSTTTVSNNDSPEIGEIFLLAGVIGGTGVTVAATVAVTPDAATAAEIGATILAGAGIGAVIGHALTQGMEEEPAAPPSNPQPGPINEQPPVPAPPIGGR
jgi:RHS repeat-associated protein